MGYWCFVGDLFFGVSVLYHTCSCILSDLCLRQMLAGYAHGQGGYLLSTICAARSDACNKINLGLGFMSNLCLHLLDSVMSL
jgi:hypothetical protein